MKWVSHQLVTASAVVAVTGSPTLAIIAGSLSPLPDKIDQLCGVFGRMPIRMFNHREHSHYWGYWALIAMFAFGYMKNNLLILSDLYDYLAVFKMALRGDYQTAWAFLWPNLAFWGAIGSLFHIAEDFFSGMGVPLFRPNKLSPHIKLYTTGGISEFLVTTVCSGALLMFYLYGGSCSMAVQQMFRNWFCSTSVL